MFYGKLVAGALGLLTLGPIGLLIGLGVGHFFDRGLGQSFRLGSPESLAKVQDSFFRTSFSLLGYLAKVDGRISQAEVDHTEQLIAQMKLDASHRQAAINLFREGAKPEFQPEPLISEFLEVCQRQALLRQTLFMFLISQAMADHEVQAVEVEALKRLGGLMGYNATMVDQYLRMAQAQGRFHQQGYQQQGGQRYQAPPSRNTLRDAYAALGVNESDSDAVVKKAYRKLMSENHPDKLIAKGVPEDMIQMATERSQEISVAYEQIRKSRGQS